MFDKCKCQDRGSAIDVASGYVGGEFTITRVCYRCEGEIRSWQTSGDWTSAEFWLG